MGLQLPGLFSLTLFFFKDLNRGVDRMLIILGRLQLCKCQSRLDSVEKWTKYNEITLLGTDVETFWPDHKPYKDKET